MAISSVIYPDSLPCVSRIDGYGLMHAASLVRTPFEAGNTRQRRWNKELPSEIQLAWRCSNEQLQPLFAWLNTFGYDWFQIDLSSPESSMVDEIAVATDIRLTSDLSITLLPIHFQNWWLVTASGASYMPTEPALSDEVGPEPEPGPPDPGPESGAWNPFVANTQMAYTDANQLASGVEPGSPTTYVACNSLTLHNTTTGGKFYFEVDYVSGDKYGTNIPPAIGIGISNSHGGSNALSPCYVMKGAADFSGAARPECFPGDNIGVAVDLTAKKLWLRLNGSWVNSGNPAAGTLPDSPTLTLGTYRAAAIGNGTPFGVAASYVFRARFGTLQFLYAAPSGFAAWG
jgi:hypothetical protein